MQALWDWLSNMEWHRLFPELLGKAAGFLLGFAASVGEEDRQGLQMRRKLALDDLAQLLSGLGSATPSVVVLEDLHWADPSSLDLIERVVSDEPRGLVIVGHGAEEKEDGAGNGIRTRDIHLGKVELYH